MSLFYQILEQYPRGLKGDGWDIQLLCDNPYLPIDFVIDHPEGVYCMNDQGELVLTKWLWDCISNCNNLDWDIVGKHPNLPWGWKQISRRSDWGFIRKNPNLPWNGFFLSIRNDLDWNFVREHPNLPWDWNQLSRRSDLTLEFYQANPDLPWTKKIKVKPLQEVMLELDDWTSQELSKLAFNGYLPGSKTKSIKPTD